MNQKAKRKTLEKLLKFTNKIKSQIYTQDKWRQKGFFSFNDFK